MRNRLRNVDFVGQIIGFLVVVGVGLAVVGLNLGQEYTRPGAAITRTGIQMTIIGGLIIVVIAFVPLITRCKELLMQWSVTRRDQWRRFLGTDFSGRDIQMMQEGVLYRGRIDRIEQFLPTRRRSSKIVCIYCHKGHFVREDSDAEWQWKRKPLQVIIDYGVTVPTFQPDGCVILSCRFAGQYNADQALIFDPSDTLHLPEEQDLEASSDEDFGATDSDA